MPSLQDHPLRKSAECCGHSIPYLGDRVLLCKRNIEPRWGKWTLPAGFLELGESTAEGAVRETQEEVGANIELEGLFSIINVARVGQIHLLYRARLIDDKIAPGYETLETRLYAEGEIPWNELAFRTVKETLELDFAARRTNIYPVHDVDLV